MMVLDQDSVMHHCGNPTCYIYADGLLVSKLIYTPTLVRNYLHVDHLGSVRKATDASGSVVYSVRYEPYGAPWQASGSENPLGYLGRKMDTTIGWYCLGARFYDPEIGRFMSEDPVIGDLTSPLTLNRYAYCPNDPVNFKDPNGRFLNFLAQIIVGGLIGGALNLFLYGAECLFTGEQFDIGKAAGEFATGFVTGAIVGLTLGLSSGANIARFGEKAMKIGSKIGGKIGSFIGKAGSATSKIGNLMKIEKGASKLLRAANNLGRGTLSGGLAGAGGAAASGKDVERGFLAGVVGGFAGGGFSTLFNVNIGEKIGTAFTLVSSFLSKSISRCLQHVAQPSGYIQWQKG